MCDDSMEMLMPGEIEYRTEKGRKEDGLVLPPDLLKELNGLAAQLGLEERL